MRGSLRLKPLRAMKQNNQKRKKEKLKSKAASPKKPTSTKKTKITPVAFNSDSDEAPVGKLKKLEVHADKNLDADLPAPPPKRKAAGLVSGLTTKSVHSPPREHARTRMLSPSPPPSNFNSDGRDVC